MLVEKTLNNGLINHVYDLLQEVFKDSGLNVTSGNDVLKTTSLRYLFTDNIYNTIGSAKPSIIGFKGSLVFLYDNVVNTNKIHGEIDYYLTLINVSLSSVLDNFRFDNKDYRLSFELAQDGTWNYREDKAMFYQKIINFVVNEI